MSGRKNRLLSIICIFLMAMPLWIDVCHADSKGISIDANHFPDAKFREFLGKYHDTDKDGYLSDTEIEKTTDLEFGLLSGPITSLKGIEYLSALFSLRVVRTSSVPVSNLMDGVRIDLSKNKNLHIVDVGGSGISSINVTGLTELVQINCDNCNLEALDFSGCLNVATISCCNNKSLKLLKLNDTNNRLISLNAENNSLAAISLGYCHTLSKLYLSGNQLESVDISQCRSLRDYQYSYDLVIEDGCQVYKERYGNKATVLKIDRKTKLITEKKKVSSMKFQSSTVNMPENSTYQLNLTILPEEAADCMIVWTSNDGKVASVDSRGKITSKKLGKTKITAIAQDGSKKQATCTVYVRKPIEITSKTWNLGFGETVTIHAETAGGTYKKTYTSSNEKIATIDRNGKIKAKNQEGETVITAEITVDGKKYEDHHTLWVYGSGKNKGFTSKPLKEVKRYATNQLSSVVDVFCNALNKKADEKTKTVTDSVELLIVIAQASGKVDLPKDVQEEFKKEFSSAVKKFRRDVTGFEDCKTSVDVVKRIGKKLCDNQKGKITFKVGNKQYEATIKSNSTDSAALYSGIIFYKGKQFVWGATDTSSKNIEDEMKFLKSYSDSKIDDAKKAVKKDVEEMLNISEIKSALKTWTKGKAGDVLKKESEALFDYAKRAYDVAKKYDEVKNKTKGIIPPDLTGKLEEDVIKDIAGYGTKFQEYVELIESIPDVISF